MSSLRRLGLALACLPALVLTACGNSLPDAKIGTLEIGKYVALGDGYAAAPFSGETESANGCLRSSTNYPSLLAERIDAEEFVDATCLFARTQDVQRKFTPVRGDEEQPGQLSAVDAETDLITITVGLSDREFFRRLLEVCIEQDEEDCEEGVAVDDLVADLGHIGTSLRETFGDVAAKAPQARIYVVGYPQILPRSGSCEGMPELEQPQVDAINASIQQVNSYLLTAAREASADFIDVAALSRAHDVCADEPWVQGDVSEPRQPPRFHPLQPLNDAIASQLEADLEP